MYAAEACVASSYVTCQVFGRSVFCANSEATFTWSGLNPREFLLNLRWQKMTSKILQLYGLHQNLYTMSYML